MPIGICQPDILVEPNIVIFADGCYWHCCKGCNPDNYSIGEVSSHQIRQRDDATTKYLESLNYKVFRFWEHEIRQSPKTCIDRCLY